MAAYINRSKTLIGSEELEIPLNRWSQDDYTIQVESGTATVEGTLAQVNRGDTPVYAVLDDSSGAPLNAVGVGIYNIDFLPLEVIKITAGVGGAAVRVMQQGDC